MSIRIIKHVWENGPEDRGELLVLLALADFANDNGECWPSVPTIAAKARMDERSARRILRKLEAKGWLTVTMGGGRHGSSRYFINPDTVPPGQKVLPPDKMTPKPGQNEPETRTPVSPEPSGTVIESSVAAGGSKAVCESGDKDDAREKLLAAMGIGHEGIAGPSHFLGSPPDMAEAEGWDEMGISLQAQCRVIADVCRRERAKDPSWMPKGFRYFTGAMRDSLKAKPSQLGPNDSKADRIKFYRQMAAS